MSYTLHEKVFIQMLVEKAFRPEDSRRMIDTSRQKLFGRSVGFRAPSAFDRDDNFTRSR